MIAHHCYWFVRFPEYLDCTTAFVGVGESSEQIWGGGSVGAIQLRCAGAVRCVVVVAFGVETWVVLEAGAAEQLLSEQLGVHGGKVVLAGRRDESAV